MPTRVLCAMSGGVDSSVAALLLSRAGYDLVGMTAELFGDASAAGPCCGKAGIGMAAEVCAQLGIEHVSVDMSALFEAQVIGRFLDAYEQGRTPNPCSDCNRFVKFDAFFELADKLDCGLLATGHYARITGSGDGPSPTIEPERSAGSPARSAEINQGEVSGSLRSAPQGRRRAVAATACLATALDPNKDQSYFLACIPPEKLARIRFPIGELTKPEVRAIAAEAKLPTAARKESMDVCFMGNGTGIAELLSWHRGRSPRPGALMDDSGRNLGEHRGIEHYTIGQRRGLNLGGGTEGLVVQRLDAATNTVVVAPRERQRVERLLLSDFTDLAPGRWQFGERVLCRGRYRQELWPARISPVGPDSVPANRSRARSPAPPEVAVIPDEPLYLMAPGQWCVGYAGDVVLFGGIISSCRFAPAL